MTDERDTFSPAHAAHASFAEEAAAAASIAAAAQAAREAGAIGLHAAPAPAPAPMPASAPTLNTASATHAATSTPPATPAPVPAHAHAAETPAVAYDEDEPLNEYAGGSADGRADGSAPAAASGAAAPEPASPFDQPALAEAAVSADAVPDPTASTSPEDTAEIDVAAVEAKLNDPGSTMSFEPITEERIDTDSTFDAGTTTSLMWGARSDVGCVRSHNEDSYLVQSPLFCVCDGMGGHAAGEVASSIAVETVAKMAPRTADPALLGAAIEAANAAIIEAARTGMGKPGMGCTATAAYIEGTALAIAHVGDSRAYLLHEGVLTRVTRDHSYVEELVDAGEITADEARVHPNRSVITRALGSDPLMYADHFQLNVEEGDRLILCSDGMSSMIPDGDIERIATQSSTAQICTDNLVDAALAAGGSDNVTVIVVDVVNDGHVQKARRKRRRIAAGIAIAVAVVLAAIVAIAAFSITHSVYLGVKDDAVAVYTGIPDAPFGLKLHWLEDETSVQLKDLPEDTQSRLRAGIAQDSIEDANQTVNNYRKQIEANQERQQQNTEALRQDAESAEGVGDASAADGSDAPADSVGASSPADSVGASDAANPSSNEGGDD